MSGMDRLTGQPLAGIDHLRQSIADILRTPIGTRLMRRSYGSLLPQLIDQPNHPATRVRVYAATAGALMRWEPRLRLSRVSWQSSARPGQALLQIEGVYTPQGRAAQPGEPAERSWGPQRDRHDAARPRPRSSRRWTSKPSTSSSSRC